MAPHVVEDGLLPAQDWNAGEDVVWKLLRRDAEKMPVEDLEDLELGGCLLGGFLQNTILMWSTLEEALASLLSEKLGWKAAPSEQFREVLLTAFRKGTSFQGEPIRKLMRTDLCSIKDRDPACPSLAHALLHYKGYQGLQSYRAANWLWRKGKRSLASIFQSRVSEVFGLDIHPAAQVGWGIFFDHGTGIVIGETAVVGNGCTLLHGVTLGGTGKQQGDRHPKLGINPVTGELLGFGAFKNQTAQHGAARYEAPAIRAGLRNLLCPPFALFICFIKEHGSATRLSCFWVPTQRFAARLPT